MSVSEMQKDCSVLSSGVYTVLITPFYSDGNIDYPSLVKLVNFQLENGITQFIALGTTSESPTLSEKEKVELVKFIHSTLAGRAELIVGVGGNNTEATLNFARTIEEYATGLMVTVPYYNKPSQEGIYQHFKRITHGVPTKPVMLYNVPGRTGVNMVPETVFRVYADCPNVVAIKEASGDLDQMKTIREGCGIRLFSGDDKILPSVMEMGGRGVISVLSNAQPVKMMRWFHHCQKGENTEDEDHEMKLKATVIFIDCNPVPIKYVLSEMNIIEQEHVRLPLVPTTEDNKEKIKLALC